MFTEFPVISCPWDPESWIKAGVRLNCSNDTFGRTLYQCAPNKDNSSLVEFCLFGSVARIEKGLCLHSLSNGYLGVMRCDQFVNGCPESSYINNEIYNYPACLEINTEEHCYQADPFCPNISRIQEFTSAMSDLDYSKNVVAVLGSTLLILGLLTGLILFYWCRRKYCQYILVKDVECPTLDGETIANIKEYGIDYILKFQLMDTQHEDIAKMLCIPVEILRWPKDRLESFVKDLREGETKVYNGRCMVVGCGEAGKTTLVNNMRGENEENPESTILLDCHPNVFKVVGKTLIVTTDEEKLGPCTQICIQDMGANAENLNEITNISEGSTSNNRREIELDTLMPENNMKDTRESNEITKSSESCESDTTDQEKTEEEQQQFLKSNEVQEQQTNTETETEPKDIVKDTLLPLREKGKNERNEEKRERTVVPVVTSESRKISVMDFAGQTVYYACHHIYFSPRAFFILVIDMSKPLDDKTKDSSQNQGLMYSNWSYSDYLRYWLGSIHTYSSPQVPVILVASHSEDISEESYYRLLRPDENPTFGLFAKTRFSDVISVEDHVINGSQAGCASRYISCCKTWEAVRDFAAKNYPNPKRIVRITMKYPRIQTIDLTDPANQLMYFPCNQIAINYVNRFQEMLILDHVPPDCLSHIIVLPQ